MEQDKREKVEEISMKELLEGLRPYFESFEKRLGSLERKVYRAEEVFNLVFDEEAKRRLNVASRRSQGVDMCEQQANPIERLLRKR